MNNIKEILNDRRRGINWLKEELINYNVSFKTDCDLIRSMANKNDDFIIINGKVTNIEPSKYTIEYMIHIIEQKSNKKISIGTNTSNLEYEKII